jgi:hypothetical protein
VNPEVPSGILLSTAYMPPAGYFNKASTASEIFVESEENYHKQTFRNRCYIISPGGMQALTVPVLLGSFHKTRIRDIRIDYTKRWQQVHLGALNAAYRSSPFYLHYHEEIEKIIRSGPVFLLDLNMDLFNVMLRIAKINTRVSLTDTYLKTTGKLIDDYRYTIAPKLRTDYRPGKYIRTFNQEITREDCLSFIDLIFNTGPDAASYL